MKGIQDAEQQQQQVLLLYPLRSIYTNEHTTTMMMCRSIDTIDPNAHAAAAAAATNTHLFLHSSTQPSKDVPSRRDRLQFFMLAIISSAHSEAASRSSCVVGSTLLCRRLQTAAADGRGSLLHSKHSGRGQLCAPGI